jgi:hypothetical protein
VQSSRTMSERALLLLLVSVLSGCGLTFSGAGFQCDPDCAAHEVCDGQTNTCRPRTCAVDLDCGAVYVCGRPDGGARGTCVLPEGICRSDAECSDGDFCTGPERCAPGAPGTDARGCAAAAALPCSGNQYCNEPMDRCDAFSPADADRDGDGRRRIEAGGDDCDDNDADRFPGHPEVCDATGHDEDCDPLTYGFRDADRDGFGDARCFNTGGERGHDCDDARSWVNPLAPEVCNYRDDNCDGAIDDDFSAVLAWPDTDGDGFGAAGSTPDRICWGFTSSPYALNDSDCDDSNPAIVPGTFSCTGGQWNEVALCLVDGGTQLTSCSGQMGCYPQPNGTGICAP